MVVMTGAEMDDVKVQETMEMSLKEKQDNEGNVLDESKKNDREPKTEIVLDDTKETEQQPQEETEDDEQDEDCKPNIVTEILSARVGFTTHSITKTIKQLKKMYDDGQIRFDHFVQRGDVWEDERKAFLIDSFIRGYGTLEIRAVEKMEDKKTVWYIMDGQQRLKSTFSFLNNTLALECVSDELESLDGLCFTQIPKEIQELILDEQIFVRYSVNTTEEEERELFNRYNNGKALTNYERVRSKSDILSLVQSIIARDIFDGSKINRKMGRYKAEELFFRAYISLYMSAPSYEQKYFNNVVANLDVEQNPNNVDAILLTEEQKNEIVAVFDKMWLIYSKLEQLKTTENKKTIDKVKKRIVTPTHFSSIIPFIKISIDQNISVDKMATWLQHFFSGSQKASIDSTYNTFSTSSVSKPASIQKRHDCLARSFDVYFTPKNEK